VERQVMLRVIDQRWRSHLYEMDYLREGINLRAMGQKDPLVEWQREGFDMFGQMMHGIWQDFIRYVMHVDVKVNRPAPADAVPADAVPADAVPTDAAPADAASAAVTGSDSTTPAVAARAGAAAPSDAAAALADDDGDTALRDVQYSSPDDPSSSGGAAGMAAAARAQAAAGGEPASVGGNGSTATATRTNTPVVKSEWDKTPRNAPCPCGSGKKYKLCHGKQ
jgi:preprotein translocase subunit SecA